MINRAAFPVEMANQDDCTATSGNDLLPLCSGAPRQLTREARATQRLIALGQMAGGITHDFRNVLAVIDSGLRLAQTDLGNIEKVRRYIAAAREGVYRGERLTAQLMRFSKLRTLEAVTANVNALLGDLEMFLLYGAGPGIHIVYDLTSNLPKCLIDPTQFNVALLNLVVNSRDAMPDGGEIRISTGTCTLEATDALTPHTYVRVRVKDSGRGMSSAVLQKIFNPFFTTKGEAGTGLGLPQVGAFMRLVGGHVNVASEPGIGTSVDLLFPSAQTEESLQSAQGGDSRTLNLQPTLDAVGAHPEDVRPTGSLHKAATRRL